MSVPANTGPGVPMPSPVPSMPGLSAPGQGGAAAPDIADIKGLMPVDPGFPWLWAGIGVLAFLVLFLAVVWFVRARKRRAAATGNGPDVAAELRALRRSPGIPPKEAYAHLSTLARACLEERFAMRAGKMNRLEILAALERRDVDPEAAKALAAFLENAEGVLFAGLAPGSGELERDLDRVELFVRAVSEDRGDVFAYAGDGGEGRDL